MISNKLILELKNRILISDDSIIGLDKYDEIAAAITYIIENSACYLKLFVNHKDPSHESKLSKFLLDEDLIKTIQHSKSMDVDIDVLSMHPNLSSPALVNENVITVNESLKNKIINLQTDSELLANDRGDCLIFSKYKNKKKLNQNDFINLFAVGNKEMTKSIENFLKTIIKVNKRED